MNLLEFYNLNQEDIDSHWEEYIFENEWGSGEDRIKITDLMFWEFVEDNYYVEL